MATILSVAELTRHVRDILESRLGEVWVEGEISNYRKQSSGHHYFTLKDDRAQLACVMFARAYSARSGLILKDGMQVQTFGRLTVYEARGQYQLVVELVQTKGQGVLQAKFEALKRKLQAEGLFDPEHKKPLPSFPRRVALVTSRSGAALQDMLNILERRSPWLRILICPVRVQGEGVAGEIAEMIRYLDRQRVSLAIDVIIVARGGGSLEDIWEFNEEVLARTIYGCDLPIISAVGHEIDFTIADFVADLRAPTPSAAAELVAPAQEILRNSLAAKQAALVRLAKQAVEVSALRLNRLKEARGLLDPRTLIQDRQQKIDQIEARLLQLLRWTVEHHRTHTNRLASLLQAYRPGQVVVRRRAEVAGVQTRLENAAKYQLERAKQKLVSLERSISLLGPQQTLQRGYSITRKTNGEILQRSEDVKPGDEILTRLAEGEVRSRVETSENESDSGRSSET
ncbi:MAG: exodeoxyribonuclease VII large subunit [Verrucomicrobia bacterium]|nr:exodeoxyribonuclease VII large subunit [Verrucomicrobiota bacterium]